MEPFRPGKVISARDLNRAYGLAERAGMPAVGPPLEVIRSPVGNMARVLQTQPGVTVKVTGKDKVYPGATPPEYCYSGVQQLESIDTPVADMGGGLTFSADLFPLVELSKNGGVAKNSIVRAFPSACGAFYVFSGVAGGDATIRTKAGVIGNPDTGGAEVTITINGVDVIAYYSVVEDASLIDGVAPPDTATEVWLAPYYQEGVFGSLPNTSLSPGRAYPGQNTGLTATGTVNLRDGGGNYLGCGGGDPMVDNCVTKTLPVYWFPLAPIAGTCDGDPAAPVWTGMGVG